MQGTEVPPATACLLRSQERLLELVEDVGDTLGPEAAALIGAKAVALFVAIKQEVRS